MRKKNCWEEKKCGRQPNGGKTSELGVCPATTNSKVDGINGGINGGRACWAVVGTLCGGKVQGTFSSKMGDCMKCDFYLQVQREEGKDYVFTKTIMEKFPCATGLVAAE